MEAMNPMSILVTEDRLRKHGREVVYFFLVERQWHYIELARVSVVPFKKIQMLLISYFLLQLESREERNGRRKKWFSLVFPLLVV